MAGDDFSSPGAVWGAFAHDPRDPVFAPLRASDADRDRIARLLGVAFADGRLDREELDQRTEALQATRTLGELPALVDDLVPTTAALERRASYDLASASAAELDAKAVEAWHDQRRNAFFSFVGPTIICWIVYLAYAGLDFREHFPWPFVVTAVTGLNFLRTATGRRAIVREERAKLEKLQAKALRKRSWKP